MTRDPARARVLRTRLTLERLEDRAVCAASLTASISAGVLTVRGTSKNDAIVFKQSSGQISIDGVRATFVADNLQGINVSGGAGNDTIRLDKLKGWTKPITITSTSGTDQIRLPDGTKATLNGKNQSLTFDPDDGDGGQGGGGGGGGGSSNWFDANIQDAALRQLLQQNFADNLLSRNEMLGVFDAVQQDGAVSSAEFADLTDVANNTSLFGSLVHVADLTRNVVLGNAANANFQGSALGNLTANSTATKLDKLVDKWFLGADHPDASYSGLTVTYATASGSLFGTGPQYSHVRQGAVGDCYFVGTLAEIAQESPQAIVSMFIINGDGTYTVRFYNNGQARYVTVDSQLPTYNGGTLLYANMGQQASSSSNVLWVALAEKAYVQMNECGWLRSAGAGGGVNSYDAIAGGWFSDVINQLVNRTATDYYVGTSLHVATFEAAFNSGKMIGFGTVSNPPNSSIVGNHQYIVVAYNSATKVVTLFNPWGLNNGTSKPGLVDIPLSQIAANFDYWAVA